MISPVFDFETMLIHRHPKVEFREVGEDIFLVHVDNDQIHNLNPMAAALWRLMVEPISGREMANVVQAAFPIMAPAKVEADIRAVVSDFMKLGFVIVKL